MPQSETLFFCPTRYPSSVTRRPWGSSYALCFHSLLCPSCTVGDNWLATAAQLCQAAIRCGARSGGLPSAPWDTSRCISCLVTLWPGRIPTCEHCTEEANWAGFFSHLASRSVATRLIPFQFARGILWTLLCLGMMRYSKGNRFGQAIVVGLVFAVVMNAQLLIPNPLMSRGVRITHLIETASSNFLFGLLCVLFWTTSPRAAVDGEPKALLAAVAHAGAPGPTGRRGIVANGIRCGTSSTGLASNPSGRATAANLPARCISAASPDDNNDVCTLCRTPSLTVSCGAKL